MQQIKLMPRISMDGKGTAQHIIAQHSTAVAFAFQTIRLGFESVCWKNCEPSKYSGGNFSVLIHSPIRSISTDNLIQHLSLTAVKRKELGCDSNTRVSKRFPPKCCHKGHKF